MVKRSSMDMMFGDSRPKLVRGYHYDFSDSGKSFVAQEPGLSGSSSELCYGREEVVEIVRYTEASAAMGMTISEVTYMWKLQNVADWAKNPDVERTYFTQSMLTAAEAPQEAKMALVLSNDGWHAPH